MIIVEKINDLKTVIRAQRCAGKSIGFVPTMGFLHEGHVSLAKRSVFDNDFTIMSIFVNPTQFGPNEDFDKYPRDLDSDAGKAEAAGVDLVFIPSVREMYPDGCSTYVEVMGITDIMCGKSRPGHFRGVATVVAKLFNIVEPDKAYFGQKDAQQAAVIRKLVRDLNMNVEIVTCPIIREKDGLAMSSRNVYLSSHERKAALVLSRSLFEVEKLAMEGEKNAEILLKYLYQKISNEPSAAIDYIEIVNADTLEKVKNIEGRVLVAIAARFGQTRLIDNIVIE